MAVALAYAAGHLTWYQTTPLGQVPVLDELENLTLAEAIVGGTLPAEPFYRAPGYAAMLALLRIMGVPAAALFPVALILGVLLHAINAGLVAGIARSWFGPTAALVGGLLFALNPVFVHFATQALDAVPALTLFLAGLNWLAPELNTGRGESPDVRRWAGASLAWAAATALRPNYLPAWCGLLLVAVVVFRGRGRWKAGAGATSGLVVFALVAAWQWRVSGEPGFLPWQGSYNLWAANQPGAHGRYYVQRQSLSAEDAAGNPARFESQLQFQEDKGRPARDIRELNAHWRTRFLHQISRQPFAWLGLLARKTYALLNNWEQYNNKTYAFHRDRSPWLRWNPLGWGLVFTFGVAGFAHLAIQDRKAALGLALIIIATGAAVLLFYVSGRFRLPLAALATILAAGALVAPRCWQPWSQRRRLFVGGCTAGAALLAFSSFDDVASRATYVQDHALLARAAETIGDDTVAWQHATAALALQPRHPDALRLAVASYFNHLVLGLPPPAPESEWQAVCFQLLENRDSGPAELRAVAALAQWRTGQQPAALAEWRALGQAPSAQSARILVGDLSPAEVVVSSWPAAAWNTPLVQLAGRRFSLQTPAKVPSENEADTDRLFARLFAASAGRVP